MGTQRKGTLEKAMDEGNYREQRIMMHKNEGIIMKPIILYGKLKNN